MPSSLKAGLLVFVGFEAYCSKITPVQRSKGNVFSHLETTYRCCLGNRLQLSSLVIGGVCEGVMWAWSL